MLSFHTCIQAKAKRRALHDCFWPSLGLLSFLAASPFVFPSKALAWAGPLCFLATMTALALLWRPYRKLLFLERNPRHLTIEEDQLIFSYQKTTILSFAIADIASMFYVSKGRDYGLAILLHQGALQALLKKRPDLIGWHAKSKKSCDSDFLFAYFPKSILPSLAHHLSASSKDLVDKSPSH